MPTCDCLSKSSPQQKSILFQFNARYFTDMLQKPLFVQLLLLFAVLLPARAGDCSSLNLLPMPHNCTANVQVPDTRVVGASNWKPISNPCAILYRIYLPENFTSADHFIELLNHYQSKQYSCSSANILFPASKNDVVKYRGFEYTVQVNVVDPSLKNVFTSDEEAYSLRIDATQTAINAPTYVGFVRAVETLSQLISCPRMQKNNCTLSKLPIVIDNDKPQFTYRGIMIDTARHFLPHKLILETIDALMYNKMSVLHWHITDEDSFPLILDSHPEIAKHAAFSDEQTYTAQEAREVVRYAMVRGVRVIPELDTPGHAASWGKAPENKDIACTFGHGYMGPLDVTLEKTYQVVQEVFAEIMKIFPDPIVHVGGDEVSLTCLRNRTEVVKLENITDNPGAFELYYRKRQRKILQGIDTKRQAMYWMNTNKIQIEPGDVVHWWGYTIPPPLPNNKIVISNYGPYYLDMGVGNFLGFPYGNHVNWLDIFSRNTKNELSTYSNKDNVLGAELCLWSEMSNKYTHHIRIWMRSSSMAEHLWNSNTRDAKPAFLRRLTAHERNMNRRGIATAPATCQQCESFPEFC